MARKTEVRYVNFYTAGSEALKFDPKPAEKKQEVKLPKPRRQKKIVLQIDPVATIGICVAVVLLIVMVVSLFRLVAAQQEAEQLETYVASLQERNAQLRDTYESGYDLEEIRQIAIARGMIPVEQAQTVQIQVTVPEAAEEPTAWESFWTFLAGLFA